METQLFTALCINTIVMHFKETVHYSIEFLCFSPAIGFRANVRLGSAKRLSSSFAGVDQDGIGVWR